MSAVAQRAGVERRTLYRHFPNEADLFTACSAHYFAANPWPDPGAWRALGELARSAIAPLRTYLEEATEILIAGRHARGRRRKLLAGALRHALAFSTWQSLAANGIGRDDAVELSSALVRRAAL